MIYQLLLAITIAAFWIIAWKQFRFATFLLAGLLPTYLLRFSIGLIPFTLLETFALILIVIWMMRRKPHRRIKSFIQPWLRPLLLLLAASCFAVAIAPDPIAALGIWKAYYIEPLLIFFLVVDVFRPADFLYFLRSLMISGGVLTYFAWLQFILQIGIPTPWDVELRATSLFDYPNALGLFLAPIITIMTVWLITRWKRASMRYRILWLLSIAYLFSGVVLAKTEAAIIAVPAGIIMTILLARLPRQVRLKTGLLAFCLGMVSLVVPVIRQKLLLQDYSGQVRLETWRETIALLADNPITGAGLSGYPILMEHYHQSTLYEIFQYPHMILLNIWVELGLLGVIAVAWLSRAVLRQAYKAKLSCLVAFSGIITMMIHGLVDVPFFKNDLAMLTAILLAMTVLGLHVSRQTK